MNQLVDKYGRLHSYLRISLTDRCNLHCTYCNPLLETGAAPKKNLMSYEEILTLVRFFVERCGVTKVRLTGGELFVRKGIAELFGMIGDYKKKHPFTLGVTTNGTLLHQHCAHLKSSGVDAVNISLDSLRRDRFRSLTRLDALGTVLDAIRTASQTDFSSLKINTVIMRSVNDDELLDFVVFAIENDLHVRFIEYMPFPNNAWDRESFMSWRDMKRRIQDRYELIPKIQEAHGVGKEYLIAGQRGMIGFITPVSEHFCGDCNRLRLTAEGKMKTCLFSGMEEELDVASLLRSGRPETEIHEAIVAALGLKWKAHPSVDDLAGHGTSPMTAIGG